MNRFWWLIILATFSLTATSELIVPPFSMALTSGADSRTMRDLGTEELQAISAVYRTLEFLGERNCGWLAENVPRSHAAQFQNTIDRAVQVMEKSSGPMTVRRRVLLYRLQMLRKLFSKLDPLVGAKADDHHQLGHSIPDSDYLRIATNKTPLPAELTPEIFKAAVEGDDDKVKKWAANWNQTRQGKSPVVVTRYTPLVGASGAPEGGEERILFFIPGQPTDLYVQLRPPSTEISIIGMEKTDKGNVGWFRDVPLDADYNLRPSLKPPTVNSCNSCHHNSAPIIPYERKVTWQVPDNGFQTIFQATKSYQGSGGLSPYEEAFHITPKKIGDISLILRLSRAKPESAEKIKAAARCETCHEDAGGFFHSTLLIEQGKMPKGMDLTPEERNALMRLYVKERCESLKEELKIEEMMAWSKPYYEEQMKIERENRKPRNVEIRNQQKKMDHTSADSTKVEREVKDELWAN